jgi:hypothetical protein
MAVNRNHRWLGRVSRRDLIRTGTVAGLSAPLAASIFATRDDRALRPARAGSPGAIRLDSDEVAQTVVPISGGGTGETTAAAAFDALAPSGTASQQLMILSSSGEPGFVSAVANVQAYGATGNGTTDDTAAIQAAVKAVSGGVIFLPAGTYKVTSTISVAWNNIVVGTGRGTVVLFEPSTSADAFTMFGTSQPSGNYGTQEDQSGGFRDLMIDANNTSSALAGIHIGDALGYEISNVFIRNFSGTSGVGLHVDNHQWWTEKMRAHHVVTSNCTRHVLMEQTGGNDSLAYSEYDVHMYLEAGQTGLTIQEGVNPYANRFWLTGNVEVGTASAGIPTFLSITGSDSSSGNFSKIQDSLIFIRAETSAQSTSYSPQTISFGTTGGSNIITNCFGEILFEGGGGGYWQTSNATPGNLSGFRGIVNEALANGAASGLQESQAIQSVTTPGLQNATWIPNTTVANVQVIIPPAPSGSTISSILLLEQGFSNGVTTGLTSGTFLLPPGGQIQVNYTGSPTWHWLRAAT